MIAKHFTEQYAVAKVGYRNRICKEDNKMHSWLSSKVPYISKTEQPTPQKKRASVVLL